jgi:hypothetical protein
MGIEQQELVDAFKGGLTYAQLAEKFGITRGQVSGKLFRLGLTEHSGRMSAEERRERHREALVRFRAKRKLEGKTRKAAWLADPNFKPTWAKKPSSDLFDSALRVSLVDIEPHQCRYPYGDGPFTFCGHGKAEGSSYCAPHRLLCTEPHGRGA